MWMSVARLPRSVIIITRSVCGSEDVKPHIQLVGCRTAVSVFLHAVAMPTGVGMQRCAPKPPGMQLVSIIPWMTDRDLPSLQLQPYALKHGVAGSYFTLFLLAWPWPWPWPGDFHIRTIDGIPWRCTRRPNNELSRSRLWKVIVLKHTKTERQRRPKH